MNKIYVGNLPFSASEQEIQEAFSKFGTVEKISLIRDPESGRMKGFGFITFNNGTAAKEALKMDGKDFKGRPLKVSIARDRGERGPGDRGDRGGRGDRGDRNNGGMA